MKVLVAGASGAIGRRLLPLLVEAGHSVVGMTRTPDKTALLESLGAQAVVADALDRDAVIAAVQTARPEVIVHELTAIPKRLNLGKLDREFALTNRLRTEGTDNLLAAARAAGVRRFVAQSYGAWPYARQGSAVKTEDDPLDQNPPAALRETLAAIRHLEAAVLGAGWVESLILRYAAFYGPGTSLGEGGTVLDDIRHRRYAIVGDGRGVWSFIHIDDAASATLAAVERGAPGIYNIADDDPAPVSEWLPALAAAIGASPPRHLPKFIARLAVGEHGVVMMTEIRGQSNAKAKRELAWQPKWPSWREGFRNGLSDRVPSLAA
jgi:2-alkyl-3-oxoalkanoate reductase